MAFTVAAAMYATTADSGMRTWPWRPVPSFTKVMRRSAMSRRGNRSGAQPFGHLGDG
jgi:hypothetical protein